MTRERLLALLALYVDARHLTPEEARAIVSAYDRGELDGLTLAEPLAPASLAALLTSLSLRVLRRLVEAYRGGAVPPGTPEAALRAFLRETVDRLGVRDRVDLLNRLSSLAPDDTRGPLAREIERRARVLYSTADVATFGPGAPGTARLSAGSIERWQTAMRQAFADDIATLARLGAGGDLTPAQAARVQQALLARGRYVDGYAAHLTKVAAGLEDPLSEAQIRAQLVRASGDGRELFFENAAAREAAGMAAPVYRYVAHPEASGGRTCPPCYAAESGSPYLIGQGPVPASVCDGGGYCRCEVEVYDDPTAFARLSASGATT